jgi:hypothetical protein
VYGKGVIMPPGSTSKRRKMEGVITRRTVLAKKARGRPKVNRKSKEELEEEKLQRKILDEKLSATADDAMEEYQATRKLLIPMLNRDTIMEGIGRNDCSTNRLLLARVLQDDYAFNKKSLLHHDGTEPKKNSKIAPMRVKTYSASEVVTIMKAVGKLHEDYYNSGVLKSRPTDNKEGFDDHEDISGSDTDVDKHSEHGANNGTSAQGREKRKCQLPSNVKSLFCKCCSECLIEMKGIIMKNKPIIWYTSMLSFEHGERCVPIISALDQVEVYRVNDAVMKAANRLSELSRRWWGVVGKNNLQDSIRLSHDEDDFRFYGLWYHEAHCFIPGFNPLELYKATQSLDEVKSYNTFHALLNPTVEEIELMKKLLILFVEDIKFVKRLHKYFMDNTLFLGSVGFLAGGRKAQKLRKEMKRLGSRDRNSSTPFSVLIPIGCDGRSIFMNGVKQACHKYHIPKGSGLCFGGNIPHAGARSKSLNPLDNLAFTYLYRQAELHPRSGHR